MSFRLWLANIISGLDYDGLSRVNEWNRAKVKTLESEVGGLRIANKSLWHFHIVHCHQITKMQRKLESNRRYIRKLREAAK